MLQISGFEAVTQHINGLLPFSLVTEMQFAPIVDGVVSRDAHASLTDERTNLRQARQV